MIKGSQGACPLRFLVARCRRLLDRRRISRADAQWPDALALLASALKAGLALPQAIELAAAELASPLGMAFAQAAARLRLGETVEQSLKTLEALVPTEDTALVVQSVEVLRLSGGNLVETFTLLGATIEERSRVSQRIAALTAQGVMQAAILLALPWVLAAALAAIAPEFIAPLFQTRLGRVLLAAVVLLELAGALWLRRIVVVRV